MYGILKYRFTCTFQATETTVTPLGFRTHKLVYEREGNEKFKRMKYSGKLTFIGDDYTYFKGILDGANNCESVTILIERSCDNERTWADYWEGYFSVNDGEFDIDNCKFEVEPKISDEYSCLLDNKDQEFNIMNASPWSSVTGQYIPEFETQLCFNNVTNTLGAPQSINGCLYLDVTLGSGFPAPTGSMVPNCVVPGVGWTLYSIIYSDGVFDGVSYTFNATALYKRETKTTLDVGGSPNSPMGTGWINLSSTTIAGLPATVWVRVPYGGAYSTYTWSYGNCTTEVVVEYPTNTQAYENGRGFTYIMSYILDNLCGSLTFRSDFFQINPYYVTATNYVTGADNKVDDLIFFHASDFADPTASEKATILNLSFNGLMNILRGMFNVYWIVDEATGVFRIEHDSWSGFANTVGIDVTADATKRLHTRGTNKITFKKEDMPQEEAFKWQQAEDIDFVGKSITYDSICVTKGLRKDTTLSNVTTDTELIFYNPDAVAIDGMVIVARDNSDNTIDFETCLISNISKQNGHLSWANLHYNYHRHGRVLLEGSMNNTTTTFLSKKKTKKQVPLSFPICCTAFDPMDLIATDLGDGEVEKAEEVLGNGMLTVELMYE